MRPRPLPATAAWLADKATTHSPKTLREFHSILKRVVARANARDEVKRNVVLLREVPKGKSGRPSKSLTFDQANALLDAADKMEASGYGEMDFADFADATDRSGTFRGFEGE